MDWLELLISVLAVAASLAVLRLARKHGIVLRPDAGGLEAVPKEIHEAEMRREQEKGR